MKATWLTGMLVGAALTCAPHQSLAQDKGKTAAAELAADIEGGLAATDVDRAAGEGRRGERARDPRVPEGHEGRPRGRRPVWRGDAVEERDRGRLLQDDRGVFRAAGRGPDSTATRCSS